MLTSWRLKSKEYMSGIALGFMLALAAAVGAVTGSSLDAPTAINAINILLEGEDQNIHMMKVEHQYSRGLAAGADTSIKSGAGFLHSMTCWGSDAAATAGTIDVRDATAAGAGTVILSFPIAASLLLPQPVIVDVPFTTGLFVDFTTTNDVTCLGAWR